MVFKKRLPGRLWPFYVTLGLACTIGLTSACHQASSNPDLNPDGTRKTVQAQAVANYSQKILDTLNRQWYFSVQLFETRNPQDYIIQMIYEEMHNTDTIHFPDMGYPVKPAVKKADDTLSVYVGFLDPKGEFQYYKSVYVDRKGMHLQTIRKYTTEK